ncbi:TetR/AcrR family transcriptional regulator [Nocardia altamirensis]|uniref:TetR/AcrR family transcriptional regulator n=1 Tax=Nocardia altamirensis TaxID=472158 RepID=UPI0008408D61|nr:TetR/AcrR family transcriptional regulator [Nocardia altamirensis]
MPAEKQQVGSVWTRPRRGREQPALTREHIVTEAVALLDAEGMEALTMRQLGTRLNAGATSLYRHVANRDELIELVVDEVYGEIRVRAITDGADWRSAAEDCAESVRAMILRHPWMASTLGQVGLSYLGPNVMQLNDGLVGLFEVGGFPAQETGDAISALMSYVIGMGIAEAAWLAMLTRSGQTEQEFVAQLRPAAEAAAKDYPRFQQNDWDSDPTEVRDRKFRYGLVRILDGLEARRS